MSDKPMRYRDSEGDIWEAVPDVSGAEQLLDVATGNTSDYDHVLSQYGPLTLVYDDEPAEGTPAPRDGDLTRLIRDAMKRFGVPAVMAEAGRLAQQRL